MNEPELRAYLLDRRNRVPPAQAAKKTDDSPGIYAIFVKDENCLPSPFQEHLKSRGHFCIYIGKTSHGMRRRLVEYDLNGKGASSFFRSLGVVLSYRPSHGSLIGKSNQSNFRFCPSDRQRIAEWVENHLLVAWQKLDIQQVDKLEVALIRCIKPLLNLQNNPSKLRKLEELRDESRRRARKQ